MSDAKLHEMIANACLHSGAEADFTADLRAYLERHALDAEDVEAILRAPPRLGLYRRLIRNNLVGVTSQMMPRARARLNAIAAGAFDETFDAFLEAVAPRTHYLRDVPGEFLAWAIPRWKDRPDIPAYVADLAAHELVEFAIAAAPTPLAAPPLAEIGLDRPLVFADARRLARYGHAVHELPPSVDDRTVPAERDVSILVYRDANHRVRFLDLSPLAATIVERLFAGESLATALGPASALHGHVLDDAILADVARLLADLGERGVLLGARG